jgi:glycosyltransferase involved in cell wall biosynthesis
MLNQIDVVIVTFNEAPNIERTLQALARFPEVVVLDSGSTDATVDIARSFPNVRLAHRPFTDHASQWQHAIEGCGLRREWLLALDADYLLPPSTVEEIASLSESTPVNGFISRFRYSIHGRILRSCLYPPRPVLVRRTHVRAIQDGHTQRLVVQGELGVLLEPIVHDDRKPLARWLSSQVAYAQLEAGLLRGRAWSSLRWPDRLRRLLVVTPWLAPLYCLTIGGGILDGKAGLYYAVQRGVAEAILSLKLLEEQLAGKDAR